MSRSARTMLALLGAATLMVACGTPTDSSSSASSSSITAPETTAASPTMLTPVLVNVVAAPVPVPATDGKVHLAYELQVINVLSSDVTLKSLSVKAADRTLLTLAGNGLAYWTRAYGAGAVPTAKLGAGQGATVWLDVAVDGGSVPTDLTHTVVVDVAAPSPPLLQPTMTAADLAPVAVSTRQPIAIAPPLTGSNWLDGNSCCDMTPHRMALNPLNGQQWAAERFAIDYVRLQDNGTLFTGDITNLDSYPYFGADIQAVADGPVVAVLDGLPEQIPGKSPTGLPLEQYAGNHVVQDIGGGNYALYAHLKTGSVQVKPGDQLTTGQVVANLGNTGNTDAPHLHFHVMSTPDPLRSNGLPFVIKNFTLAGRLGSMNDLDPLSTGKPVKLQPGTTPRDETDLSPLVLDVMTYAEP